MKSKLIKTIIACFIVGVIGVGGYYGYKNFFMAKPAVAATSYMTVTAKNMNMQVNVQGTGSAFAAISKDIVANNSGEIKELNAKVGDSVKVGDKLLVVDSDQVRQNLDKAQSDLEKQKLQLSKAKTEDDIAMQNLNVSSAQKQVDYAYDQLNKMAVKSPINGVIVAKNNNNGDSVQSGKAIFTVVDPSSMKIKVSVDELDIGKVKLGQKAEIKFDSIKDKNYEGTVDEISQLGTTTNNVTTYDVILTIKDPINIKIGMNANVNILVESKDNALAIQAEALMERNGNKYVMVSNSDGSGNNASSAQNSGKTQETQGEQASTQNSSGTNSQGASKNSQGQGMNAQGRRANGTGTNFSTTGGGKLVQIKTGLENENYIEVLEGLTEGEKILVALPQNNASNSTTNRNGFSGGFGGNMGGFGGNGGGSRSQTSNSNSKK